MDSSNQSIDFFAWHWWTRGKVVRGSLQNIEGGNEDNQRKHHEEVITKVIISSKPKWLMTHSYSKVLKIRLNIFPTMFETWMNYSTVGYSIGVYVWLCLNVEFCGMSN